MIMGLPFSVHLRSHSTPDRGPDGGALDGVAVDAQTVDILAIEEAVEAVWDSLRWADRVFSTYRPDSDISRIRRGEIPVRDADPAVAQVLDFAEIARRLTGGTFDVNNGRRHGRSGLDPSGIVKGWAASRAAAPLAALGMDYYLNAGGDVLLQSAGHGQPWRIGIEHPDDPQGLLAVVELATGAVATSGRTHRGEHIWNPATGRPAAGIAQATVVGPSLVWADILATAVVAGGIERLDLAQWPPGHDLMLVTDDGAVLVSEGFVRRFAGDVPAPPFSLVG